jgi:hypothetical protein
MKIYGLVMILAIISITLISGCTQPTTVTGGGDDSGDVSICGNGVVESGEQCDGTGCSSSQTCNNQCLCVNVGSSMPQPPAFPD